MMTRRAKKLYYYAPSNCYLSRCIDGEESCRGSETEILCDKMRRTKKNIQHYWGERERAPTLLMSMEIMYMRSYLRTYNNNTYTYVYTYIIYISTCIMNSHTIKVTTAGLSNVEALTTHISYLEKCIGYYA